MIDPKRKLRGCALVAVFSLAGAASFAQTPGELVARLKNVNGNVLVSRESGLAAGDEALRIAKGTRVITTANSEVTVVYDNGCEVKLKENQRFEITVDKPCRALATLPHSILLQPEGAALASATLGGAAFAAATPALGVAGVAAILSARSEQTVSPN